MTYRAMRRSSSASLMEGWMVSALSMVREEAARPARADLSRSLPCR